MSDDDLQAYFWWLEWCDAWRLIGAAVEQWRVFYLPFMEGL